MVSIFPNCDMDRPKTSRRAQPQQTISFTPGQDECENSLPQACRTAIRPFSSPRHYRLTRRPVFPDSNAVLSKHGTHACFLGTAAGGARPKTRLLRPILGPTCLRRPPFQVVAGSRSLTSVPAPFSRVGRPATNLAQRGGRQRPH